MGINPARDARQPIREQKHSRPTQAHLSLRLCVRSSFFFFLCGSAALRAKFLTAQTQKNRRFSATATVRAQFENWEKCTGVPSRCQANYPECRKII
jgi:hypothetical protein